MKTDETRALVEKYFRTWTSGDCEGGGAMMAEDVSFVTPLNRYNSPGAVVPQLKRFTTLMKKATLIRSIVEGEDAAMLYEIELPQPAGTLRTTELVKVANGKLRAIELVYDSAGLKKLMFPERA